MGLINEHELVNTTNALGNYELSLAGPLHSVFPLQLYSGWTFLGQRGHSQLEGGCKAGEGVAENCLDPQMLVHKLPCSSSSCMDGQHCGACGSTGDVEVKTVTEISCVYGQRNVNQGVICLSEEQSARGADPPHRCVHLCASVCSAVDAERWCTLMWR